MQLPFAKGSRYLQSMLEDIQGFALSTYADVADPQSLSLGVGIDQQGGVALNGRVHTGPKADLSPFFPAQPQRREVTLNRLRDGEIAFAIGGYLSPQYNELLTLRLQESLSSGLSIEKLVGDEREKWLAHLTKAKINVQRFQFGVYSPVLPDPPPLAVAKQPEDNEKPIKGKKLAIQKNSRSHPRTNQKRPFR